MVTPQALVTEPWAPWTGSKEDETMSCPFTSTGPRMYLMAGVLAVAGSHVTKGLAGSDRGCLSWAGLAQSKASNALYTSAVTQLVSLALAGAAVGLGRSASLARDST